MVKMTATGFPKGRMMRKISWQEFEKKYLSREDGFKYEWVNGTIEKTKRTMNQHQLFILFNLRKLFSAFQREYHNDGGLEPEVDTFFLETVHRRPDIAYFNEAQIAQMAYGKNQVPEFVIKIISTHDTANLVQQKMKNYRDAGVRVVWLIYPDLQEVHVYHGEDSTVCSGEKICTAAPVLPDFSMPAKLLFVKPPKPE